MADEVQVGDKVSWNWGGGHPGGTVGEVKAGEVTVTSHRGNEIKKTGDESNPAVHIERPGNDVVKKASELQIEEKTSADSGKKGEEEGKEENVKKNKSGENEEEKEKEQNSDGKDEKEKEQNGDSEEKEDGPKAGDKRKANEKADASGEGDTEDEKNASKEAENDAKKHKTDDKNEQKEASKETTNGADQDAKKGPGRPKSNGEKKSVPKKEKKFPAVGKSERKTRSQGAA